MENKIKTAFNVILISGMFVLVLSIVMLMNYIQLAGNDPVESETMTALLERLADDPKNEALTAEIRSFDLMARKAYFTAKWQIQTGGWLLLIGAVVFVLALRIYIAEKSRIGEPDKEIVPKQMERILSSKWILGMGFAFIVAAVFASFFSQSQLDRYQPEIVDANTQDDQIEYIDLTGEEAEDKSLVKQAQTETQIPEEAETPENETQAEELQDLAEKPQVTETKSSYPGIDAFRQQSNSFRGPMGNGVAFVEKAPLTWDATAGTNIVWKVEVPVKGFSSPVIWDNKLYLTGANDQERWVYCYNKSTGDLLWQHKADNIPGSPAKAPKTTDDTGLAAPSVVTNGKQVVAIFGTGDVVGLSTSGERLWAKNLGVPDNHYGHSSSLLNWKEKVIIQYDTNRGGRMLALHIENGDVIWDVERPNNISWASPILVDVDGKMQVVTSAEPTVAGHDVETGKELWKVECMMGEVGPSPAYGNGLIFATNEYATLAAIDPAKGEIVWEDNYYLPEVASPVVSDGLLFIATTYGVFAAFDAHTGNMYWEAEFDEGFYASPIVAKDHVYATDMKGVVHVMKVDRELHQVANNNMGEAVMTTPTFDDGKIFIRGNDHLFCIGE